MQVEKVRNKIEEFLKSNEEYENFKIDYILFDKNYPDKSLVAASYIDECIEINPSSLEVTRVADWAFSIDEEFFRHLENGKSICYITMPMNYSLWYGINKLYPEEITNKDGVQAYLNYCRENNITKDMIDKTIGYDVPNAMEHFNLLDKVFDNNLKIIDTGYRREQPIALVKRERDDFLEYIVAFDYEFKDNRLYWGYGYYYSDDLSKATADFKKVLNNGNLADTFSNEKQEREER